MISLGPGNRSITWELDYSEEISWGLAGLDQKTGGLKRGELFILAGKPGMGKTALAICIAAATASAGEPTFLSSLEMGDVSVSDRGFASSPYG